MVKGQLAGGANGRSSASSAIGGGKGKAPPNPSPAAPKIRNTKTKHKPGMLVVKEYPITEDRLDNIGNLRLSAAFFSSVGSLCAGFWLSTYQALSLAGDSVAPTTRATWEAYELVVGAATIVAFIAAIFYFFRGQSAVNYVKDNTTHDPE